MNERVTDDTRISDIEEVIVPESIKKEIPISEKISNLVFDTRDTISKIIKTKWNKFEKYFSRNKNKFTKI